MSVMRRARRMTSMPARKEKRDLRMREYIVDELEECACVLTVIYPIRAERSCKIRLEARMSR